MLLEQAGMGAQCRIIAFNVIGRKNRIGENLILMVFATLQLNDRLRGGLDAAGFPIVNPHTPRSLLALTSRALVATR